MPSIALSRLSKYCPRCFATSISFLLLSLPVQPMPLHKPGDCRQMLYRACHAWFYMRCNEQPTNRKAVAHSPLPWCRCLHVRRHNHREEHATAAITTLHAVCDIQRAVLVAKTTDQLQKTFVCNVYSADALYAFNNYDCDLFALGLKVGFNAASSLKGRKSTLPVSLTGAIIFGLSVAATASEVLPWKAFEKAMIFFCRCERCKF